MNYIKNQKILLLGIGCAKKEAKSSNTTPANPHP